MNMHWLERDIGPMRARAWVLILNFLMNVAALTGLALWLDGRGGATLAVAGFIGTVFCISILAVPDRSDTMVTSGVSLDPEKAPGEEP